MTDATIRTASCACGALQVTTDGPPSRTMLCSCLACQKRTGSVLGVSAYWPEAHVQTTGTSTTWHRAGGQGRQFENHFCPTCGSTLWWRPDFAPGMIGVAGGGFDESDFINPQIAYWACRRPDWLSDIFGIKTLDRQG